MNENPLISIIIPCYNDAQYIEQSVQSALDQTYHNKEIIVVDDGSNIKTKAVLKKLEPKIAKLITQENQGQSTARNEGIKASKGDFILILDSDDFFEPTFCDEAIAVLNTDLSIKIMTCHANLLFLDNRKEIYIPKGGNIKNFMYSNDSLGSCLFKKKDWVLCGGYDQNMRSGLEDWEFFIRLLKNGGVCYVIPKILYNYRKRNDSTTSKALPFKYDILNYIFLKHKDLYINNIESFIEVFSTSLKRLENEKIRVLNSKEFQIGNKIIVPFRFVKKIIHKIILND